MVLGAPLVGAQHTAWKYIANHCQAPTRGAPTPCNNLSKHETP